MSKTKEEYVYTLICEECGNECRRKEVTFEYAGTHCTHGRSGTHHTGEYESSCCGANYHEE